MTEGNVDFQEAPVRAIILADIHMLGPRKGHWLDKLRREWQMHRSYQSSMTLFRPDLVFILGLFVVCVSFDSIC